MPQKLRLSVLRKQVENARAQAENASLPRPNLNSPDDMDGMPMYQQLFSFYDTDGSGSISVEELSDVLEKLGINSTKENLAVMIQEGM